MKEFKVITSNTTGFHVYKLNEAVSEGWIAVQHSAVAGAGDRSEYVTFMERELDIAQRRSTDDSARITRLIGTLDTSLDNANMNNIFSDDVHSAVRCEERQRALDIAHVCLGVETPSWRANYDARQAAKRQAAIREFTDVSDPSEALL